MYGAPLAEKMIQPVWIEIENKEDVPYWLLFPGLDPNFFPASEAAEAMARDEPGKRLDDLDRRFRQLAFRNPVPPGGKVAGFVLTNLQEGVKLLQIDLFATHRSRSFSFLAGVPGLRADYHVSKVFRKNKPSAPESVVVDYTNDAEFRAALKALPCCVTNKDGSKNGDPLNLIVIGGLEDAFPALIRRGWSPTETTWRGSVHADNEIRHGPGALPVRADKQPVPLRSTAGRCATEGSRQHSPAQPSSPLAQSDALPGQAGLGGADQSRHR